MTSETRDRFEPWLEAYLRKRFPELERPLIEAIDAFDELASGTPIETDRLKPLVFAASSDRSPLYENATELLGQLAVKHDAARQAVEGMAVNSKAQVRFNAIICVNASWPRKAALEILRNRLRDSSSRVREKAADWALRYGMKELVPELTAALRNESNSKARSCIDFALQQLRRSRSRDVP